MGQQTGVLNNKGMTFMVQSVDFSYTRDHFEEELRNNVTAYHTHVHEIIFGSVVV